MRIAGGRAYLTIKGLTQGASRPEFEYEIPLPDGEALLTLGGDARMHAIWSPRIVPAVRAIHGFWLAHRHGVQPGGQAPVGVPIDRDGGPDQQECLQCARQSRSRLPEAAGRFMETGHSLG